MPYCLSLSAALRGPNRFHVIQRDALAVPVPGLPEDRGRVLEGADRLLKPPHQRQRQAQIVQRLALAVPVPGLPEDRGRVLMRADRLLKPELAPDRVFVRSVLR